ncbi:MAG: SGNH/GDSL hydrolase family protein [Candidatus Omnitrophica bacterium]|nr:SGNH/GDSL hydrolase family protein [Candidatus Omnitrophota bacterium]
MLKNISLSLIALLISIIILEMLARTAGFLYSGDGLSFSYGLDSSVKVMVGNKKITFVKKDTALKGTSAERGGQESAQAIIRIAAFGGSTTYGYHEGKVSSSWPAELEMALNKRYGPDKTGFRVLNLGTGGASSDYAAEHLSFSQKEGEIHYILWCNYINESDILYSGPYRNAQILYEEFTDILKGEMSNFTINRVNIFLHRLDKTLKKYSLFYTFLHRFIYRTYTNMADVVELDSVDEWYKQGVAGRFIDLPLRNYELNFLEAERFCDENDIKLIIVRLPLKEVSDTKDRRSREFRDFYKTFRTKLDKLTVELAKKHGAGYINVQEYYERSDVPEDAFHDRCHQTQKGNTMTGEFLADELIKLISER